MLGRKGKSNAPAGPKQAAPDGNPWDRSTLDQIGGGDRINIQVTHLEIRRRFGGRPDRALEDGALEVIGTGFLAHVGQHVYVELTFGAVQDHLGVAVFDYQLGEKYKGGNVHVPLLHVILNDRDGSIVAALREGMRDVLLSGETVLAVRCWCSFPRGWADANDIRCPITGFNIWSNLVSPRIPEWQRPMGENNLSDIPDATKLRAYQDR
jgi:hypothetical protein